MESLSAGIFETVLKCPDYQGVLFRGFELSEVSCLGPRNSVMFIEVFLFCLIGHC